MTPQIAPNGAGPPPSGSPPRRRHPACRPRPSADRKFEQFHAENPHVLDELVRLAREAITSGRSRLGIKAIWEVCRWNLNLSTTGRPFKLDNSMTAAYARMIMEQHPDLRGVFETRCRRRR
jgi:hypothetical protein